MGLQVVRAKRDSLSTTLFVTVCSTRYGCVPFSVLHLRMQNPAAPSSGHWKNAPHFYHESAPIVCRHKHLPAQVSHPPTATLK